MIIKKSLFAFFIFHIFLSSEVLVAQIKTYPFEQVDSLQKNEKRNVLVFIYTDWCKYCEAMKNTTLKNKSIISKLNKEFYFIELNAEEKSEIIFDNRTFKYKPTGYNIGVHELVEELAFIENKITYPTLCFLNPDFEIIFQYNQFVDVKELNLLLNKLEE